MKLWKVFFGVGCILLALFAVLDSTGALVPFDSSIGEISFLRAAVGLLLIWALVRCVVKRRIPGTIFFISLLFMTFEKNIAYVAGVNDNIINNRVLFFSTILVCIGIELLIPGKHFGLKISSKSAKGHRMASNIRYIDCATLSKAYVENNLGSTTVKFENVELYRGDGTLHVENNLGRVLICVPKNWILDINLENNMGHVSGNESNNASGPLLTVIGENNMGNIHIERT